ncbi:MAG TPA: ABC transporter ATP-binding protein [Spirochaetia bacterium]|nr:ABC transporter ATP-binding protein [Spirochaetia bacterium]
MVSAGELLLEVRDLQAHFHLLEGTVRAVDGVSFDVSCGSTVGIIGESGSGKSVMAQAILRIIPSPPGKIMGGKVLLHDLKPGIEPLDLTTLPPDGDVLRGIRGNSISMIFQEPMASFGPLTTIGSQISEAILTHTPGCGKKEAMDRTVELLARVGIPKPSQRKDSYPYQFSGGMLQRAMIAMALSCSPRLLIADEPTTAVDVTIQAQLMELLARLQEERHMAILLITHNLAVVSELAQHIVVMYLGRIVERSTVQAIFESPLHPYTRALWRSIPKVEGELTTLKSIQGTIPSPYETLTGCPFFNRCEERMVGKCDRVEPPTVEPQPGHWVSCLRYV